MLKVNSTEIQNNFGKYLLLAREQDVVITRNGRDVARLTSLGTRKDQSAIVSEKVLAKGYGLREATYEEFLELTQDSEERYEYIDGEIFLQASPKTDHQLTLVRLLGAFIQFFGDEPCQPLVAPYDIAISRSKNDINVVQPDLMVICDLYENLGADGYYKGVPDLVVEILPESTRRNDLLKKPNLYLEGGVKEYWVVDPQNRQVTVYCFENRDIRSNITFRFPEKAHSPLFPRLMVDLAQTFPPIIQQAE